MNFGASQRTPCLSGGGNLGNEHLLLAPCSGQWRCQKKQNNVFCTALDTENCAAHYQSCSLGNKYCASQVCVHGIETTPATKDFWWIAFRLQTRDQDASSLSPTRQMGLCFICSVNSMTISLSWRLHKILNIVYKMNATSMQKELKVRFSIVLVSLLRQRIHLWLLWEMNEVQKQLLELRDSLKQSLWAVKCVLGQKPSAVTAANTISTWHIFSP